MSGGLLVWGFVGRGGGRLYRFVPFNVGDSSQTGVYAVMLEQPIREELEHVAAVMQRARLLLWKVLHGGQGIGFWCGIADLSEWLQSVGIIRKESRFGVAESEAVSL